MNGCVMRLLVPLLPMNSDEPERIKQIVNLRTRLLVSRITTVEGPPHHQRTPNCPTPGSRYRVNFCRFQSIECIGKIGGLSYDHKYIHLN
jgi:hypothetical protein